MRSAESNNISQPRQDKSQSDCARMRDAKEPIFNLDGLAARIMNLNLSHDPASANGDVAELLDTLRSSDLAWVLMPRKFDTIGTKDCDKNVEPVDSGDSNEVVTQNGDEIRKNIDRDRKTLGTEKEAGVRYQEERKELADWKEDEDQYLENESRQFLAGPIRANGNATWISGPDEKV